MPELMPLEDAVRTVLDHIEPMPRETVELLEATGRVAADDLHSDIDVSAFDHTAMDGFALSAAQIEDATEANPVELDVVGDVGAGSSFEGAIPEGACVRIMTGAPIPADADAVVKYEIVDVVSGDGKTGSRVSFSAPTKLGCNIRRAGEEAKAGECIVSAGEVIKSAGIGFLGSCGVTHVTTYGHPRVAIICTGSELVPIEQMPGPGQIRNSNGVALAACVQEAGGIPCIMPIVEDSFEALEAAILDALPDHDVVITTGGAADGDYDFIKPVADKLGDVHLTAVNMRPGKSQTFAIVQDVPVFGLSGNPAAAYMGFQMLVRPALRKMQGYTQLQRFAVKARLTRDTPKRDPRRIYLRAVLDVDEQGYAVTPATNQSSGSFGAIQRANCLAIMPEGNEPKACGDIIDCLLLDVDEGVVL